ncbi:MAG: HpaII family restriction endonuclease [Lachnospiraceae bacterium]|jgi:type II restriction enzyme|nr:HpaII family restriction endonuclease [Lachnospiraceae bacterium]
MAILGNKGEWSELYVFLRLLADGKLYAADENLNKIDTMFFPIIKIIREDTIGQRKEYRTGSDIRFMVEDDIIRIPAKRFYDEADCLLQTIIAASGSRFSAEKTEEFMKLINVVELESRSRDKADIIIQIHDIQTGYESEVGFSIKSKLGKPATLFNASKATNFTFEIVGEASQLAYIRNNLVSIQGTEKPNQGDKSAGVKEILTKINSLGCGLIFYETDKRFEDNLKMIDSQMPIVVAELLLTYYFGNTRNRVTDIVDYVVLSNPLAIKQERAEMFYKHKVKLLLCAAALGMKPTVEWNGTDEATGGYIVVKSGGEVVAYHIYNRDKFMEYLYNNTRFEAPQRFDSLPPKTKKGFDFGYIYEENGKLFIKLNLQIRFI